MLPTICRHFSGEPHAQSSHQIGELPVGTEQMTFENFKVTPELQRAYDLALQMAEGSGEVTWLTLMAGTGRGKTRGVAGFLTVPG